MLTTTPPMPDLQLLVFRTVFPLLYTKLTNSTLYFFRSKYCLQKKKIYFNSENCKGSCFISSDKTFLVRNFCTPLILLYVHLVPVAPEMIA
jgi:hypothetical protein